MLELEIIVGFCLVILAAWFLLRIDLAEAFVILLVLSAAALGIYWLWSGGRGIPEGVGIFALLVIALGFVRLGTEKLGDMLAALLPPPFGTKGKARAGARSELSKPHEGHHPVLPR